MCALRGVPGLCPEILVSNYRLNNKSTTPRKTITGRGKPPEEMSFSSRSSSLTTTCSDFSSYLQEGLDEQDYSSDEDCSNIAIGQSDDSCVFTYLAICKKKKCTPITSVRSGLTQNSLSCKFVQMQPLALQCICTALCNCRHVERIVFQQNDIGAEGATLLAVVIQQSSFIRNISITENNLRSEGASVICEAVTLNTRVSTLDLSSNGFVESDGQYFKTLIESCYSLTKLNLSNNCLSEEGVKKIAEALANCCSLIELDLSWNHIRLEGATAIGEALSNNDSLQTLNLAWNGLHMEGAQALAKALEENDTLVELDLTSNRLSDACLVEIMTGLDTNTTLQRLRIKKNQITSNGALAILTHLNENGDSGIKLIDFGTQEVHDKFEILSNHLLKDRDINVIYGTVWRSNRRSITSFDESADEVALLSCNPLTVLMECMRVKNLRLMDYFNYLDSNKNKVISVDELCEGLMKMNVPVCKLTLEKLVHRLDKDGNKMLDFTEMLTAQQKYKKKWRKSMAAGVDFEKTEIGRVAGLVRKIINKKTVMKKYEHDTLAKPGSQSREPSPTTPRIQ